jgi:hypothetical protein
MFCLHIQIPFEASAIPAFKRFVFLSPSVHQDGKNVGSPPQARSHDAHDP